MEQNKNQTEITEELPLAEKIEIIERHFAKEALAYALDKRALRESLDPKIRTLALNEYQGHLDNCNALLDAALDVRGELPA